MNLALAKIIDLQEILDQLFDRFITIWLLDDL